MAELKFGMVAPAGESPENLVEFIKRCEGAGFDSFWAADHMAFVTKAAAPEVWSVIAAAAMETERISMGTVSDPHRMHPTVFAQRLATVDHLSDGRIMLGLGAGEAMNLDPYGIRWKKPLSKMIEAIKVMRMLWESEGPVDYQGEFFNLSRAFIGIKPVQEGGIPIYMASNRPRSRRFAGQLSNGWIPAAMSASLYAKFLKDVEEGAKEAGRSPDDIDKVIYTYTSVAKDLDSAYEAIAPVRHALIWLDLVEEAGYELDIPEEYRNLHYTNVLPTDEEMKRKFRELGKLFPREVVLDFLIVGTREDCIRRIEEYINNGVKHFVMHDFSPDPEEAFRILAHEVIPYFRG